MKVSSIIISAKDNYPLNVRIWNADNPRHLLIMLHGVVSHSLWLREIAERLIAQNITVVCPDRRGSGTNQIARGDAANEETLLQDLDIIVHHFSDGEGDGNIPIHLCGFCWGANYAVNYMSSYPNAIKSLCLLAPAMFSADSIRAASLHISASSSASEPPVIPLEAFTEGPAYQYFILPDPLRLTRVSPRFNGIMQRFSYHVGLKLVKLSCPILLVLARADTVVDNDTTARAFEKLKAYPKKLAFVPGAHGIQFDAPDESAKLIADWVAGFSQPRTTARHSIDMPDEVMP